MIEVKKLADTLGAEVDGVDLSRPLDGAAFTAIRAAWLEHAVLRFRDQQLTDPQLIAFARCFGELDPPGPNPYGKPFLPEHPELNVISNIKVDGMSTGGDTCWANQCAAHATQPRFVFRHQWRVGDVIVWDNRCTLHRRDPFDPNARRLMHRSQIKAP